MNQSKDDPDIEKLQKLVAEADRRDELDEHHTIPVSDFRSMLARFTAGGPLFSMKLFDKQRAYIRGVFERTFEEPEYENLVSSGKVPRGREVPTPDVLRVLPKKPPPRRVDED